MSRRCCPVARALWREFSAEMAGELLGSPQAMVRLHGFMLFEAFFSMVLLLAQLVIFWALLTESVTAAEKALLTVLACVPILAMAAKAVALYRMEARCRQLAREFATRNAAVATGMVRLLQSRSSRAVQGLSLFLVVWYTFCVVWNYAGPPCERYTEFTFELEFWKLTAEQAPCSSWESLCTLLLMFAAVDGLTLLWGPTAVHRFQGRFVPAPSQGMPLEALAGLSEVAYGGEGAPRLEDPTCTICIDPLKDGEMIRQLPCGHCFHTTCVDSWLVRHASCPMRCPNDELLRAAFGPGASARSPARRSEDAGGAESPPPAARWAEAAGPGPRASDGQRAPAAATLGRPASPREQSSAVSEGSA